MTTELSTKVFLDRYAQKDETGVAVESSPEEMWSRVAWAIATQEKSVSNRAKWYQKFYDVLEDFRFVPGGRILAGAGTGAKVTYYNCFVIPSPEDSRGGIIANLGHMVELMSRGGGVGVNLSSLRPRGAYIKTVNGHSSGPIAWANLYSVATGQVIQQGGSRRGALMLMLNDHHPDIEEFITVKEDLTKLNHANLSICISDRFMEAVKAKAAWQLHWGGKVYKTIDAETLWAKICQSAWKSGEPGLVFMERYNKVSNTWYYEEIICVNPCGEQGLPEWGVCNLGAMNLSKYVETGYDGKPAFNFRDLGADVQVATRFLDNVVDANSYFMQENKDAQLSTRRIGLGTMGLADALIKMELPYGSAESLTLIEEIYQTIRDNTYRASVEIAKEKGPFPKFQANLYAMGEFIKQLPRDIQEDIYRFGIRNAVLLTQAPTGTTSMLAGVSSGIEPVYEFIYVRKDRLGQHLVIHPLLEEYRAKVGDVGAKPEWFVSANDLTPDDHVKVQALIQKYTDSSISKTVNAPNHHTVEQVMKLYMDAYDLGCKGVTYFRDGCREGVLNRIEDPKTPEACPECQSPLTKEEGCTKCYSCGFSYCG